MTKRSAWGILFVLIAGAIQAAEYDPEYDHNKDGIIDHQDLFMLQERWHTEGEPVEQEIIIELPGLPSGAIPLTMVYIPPGSFEMGSPEFERSRDGDEGPVHTVNIAYDFYMSKYEITQAQWTALMGSNPADDNGVGDDYPVYNVNWLHCADFVDALNDLGVGLFRLPSEAEWEYCCRAGTSTRFHFGDSLGCADDCSNCEAGTLPGNRTNYMWYCGNNSTTRDVKAVGLKIPNAFGLYDMLGNVREWVRDWHHDTYDGAPTDGSPWLVPMGLQNVVRGGDHDDTARYCRSANREREWPADKWNYLGFRVAGNLTPLPTKSARKPRR
jgi:formylglycine-generating enzyme required for sulfatase activity